MFIGNSGNLLNGLSISVDWLSFTIKTPMTCQDVIEHFGFTSDCFQHGLRGSNGYKFRLRHCIYPISILYDGSDNMGIHVDVSGSAVGYFLQCYLNKYTVSTPFGSDAYTTDSFNSTVLADVLKDILDFGQLTRLDLAIDDLGCSYFTMSELQNIFESGLYVSKFRKFQLNKSQTKTRCLGHTIYFGSRESAIMLRIYDKQLEQIAKHKKESNSMPWVRWELEMHHERACVVALLLIDGVGVADAAVGILSNYLRLIRRDNARDCRCSNLEKWDRFINDLHKIILCQPIKKKSIDEKKEWLKRQVAPTLAAIYELDGDLGFIYDLIECGSFRLSSELSYLLDKEMKVCVNVSS